jgi:hypothetical protein
MQNHVALPFLHYGLAPIAHPYLHDGPYSTVALPYLHDRLTDLQSVTNRVTTVNSSINISTTYNMHKRKVNKYRVALPFLHDGSADLKSVSNCI